MKVKANLLVVPEGLAPSHVAAQVSKTCVSAIPPRNDIYSLVFVVDELEELLSLSL
jgi:hypothetical protein